MKYLLDTNILSEPLVKHPSQRVLGKLAEHQHELATAAPVWHELIFGAARLPASQKKRTLTAYLQDVIAPSMPILPYDEAAAAWHGQQRARLSQAGRTPAFVDGQIAAIARLHGLALVTRNTADFAGFQKLVIENWFDG